MYQPGGACVDDCNAWPLKSCWHAINKQARDNTCVLRNGCAELAQVEKGNRVAGNEWPP